MDPMERFWNVSLEEMKRGYMEEPESYCCLFCGEKTEKGRIYLEDEAFYEAEKYLKVHMEKAHGSVFEQLIGLDKKVTGLSEHQSKLLWLFYEGKSDSEVQKEMDIGSSSTIRNHRFVLKEKERQAKVFLVIMELLKGVDKKAVKLVPPHKTAKMVDDRYNVSEDEYEKLLEKYFPDGLNGPLKTFDMREKNKLVVLRQIIKRFRANCTYTEKEVNAVLKDVYHDFATLRRYLIEYGFMDRKSDGSEYWVKENLERSEEKRLDRKKELVQQYKEMKTEAGVYVIRNKVNQKVLMVATPNLKTMNGKRFQLQMGSGFNNKQLEDDWKLYGEDAFEFEVLEVLKEKTDVFFDKKDALKKLEEKWCDKLQPYGDKGYNKNE